MTRRRPSVAASPVTTTGEAATIAAAAPHPAPAPARSPVPQGPIGERLRRTDGPAKVTGAFAYSSDLTAPGMLHGATLRSPHAAARIERIDTAAARALPGVHAVLTHADLPGAERVGSVLADQPVLAFDEVRHHGEPVALVAADDAATARRARDLILVSYEPIAPLTTVDAALAPGARAVNPLPAPAGPAPGHAPTAAHEASPAAPAGLGGDGAAPDRAAASAHPNALRTITIRHGDPEAAGEVVVRGSYTVQSQDQAFLGPESGLAIPHSDGSIELHVATQWLHVDRAQVAAGLGLAEEQVHVVLAGVGGAFGAREDLSMQLHACLLARATGRPVRMAYLRDESFLGHVHRHPAQMTYEHHATADGRLVAVRARLHLDGGAYASSSPAVIANAATVAAGPYAVPNARIDATVASTNNPPNGAMRGFGAVQVAIAYEAQMDRLAAALAMDPLELRARNALRSDGAMPTGQRVRGPVAVERIAAELRALPDAPPVRDDPRAQPGGPFAATRGEGVRRGVGYAIAYKNIAFSEGFDDPATAHVRVFLEAGAPVCVVRTAAAEVGQGVIGIQEQVARTELGVADVRVQVADTGIASAGSASASRLTWLVSGAVQLACRKLLEQLEALQLVLPQDQSAHRWGLALSIRPVFEAEATFRHASTGPIDADGQGEPHAGFAFVGHRAVVDVDVELGLARVAELTCVQDVGRAMNPLALEGQLEGASIQGLGLALTEELLIDEGIVRSRSFGSYRIPTIVDAAAVPTVILELSDPETPYGLKGVGELPSLSSTPAILAALRAATGREVTRAPARPEDLVARP